MHFTEVIRIAQRAWDTTKDKSDPGWNDCDPAHRQKFAAIAQAVIDSGHAVSDFEAAVKKFAQEAEVKREAVAEVQAEHPTAHSDEIQLEAARRKAGESFVSEGVGKAESGFVPKSAPPAEKPKRSRKAKPEGAAKKSTKKGK